MLKGRITVLIIPQEGSKTFEFKVPVIVVGLISGVVAALVVLLVIGLISYAKSQQLDRTVVRLEREKALLEEEVEQIRELEAVLSRLQRTNQQLHIILGESVGLEVEPPARRNAEGEVFISSSERLRWGRLRSLPTMWPTQGAVERSFGAFRGTVISAPRNSLVRASGGGWVSVAGFQTDLGNLVTVDHGNGIHSDYGYNAHLLVSAGDYVQKGQAIALSGNTGKGATLGLYFAIRENGEYRDPESYRLWM